jgi:hypothetical protein
MFMIYNDLGINNQPVGTFPEEPDKIKINLAAILFF